MKKLLLLFVVLCTTIPSFAVTYNLNGGKYNPYDWASKDDMLAAFLTDGGATEMKTIKDCKSLVTTTAGEDGLHSPGLCTNSTLSASTLKAAFADEGKWGWLKTYVNSIHSAQGFSDLGSDFSAAAWKYEVGAFFISGQSTSWPKGASFAEAGKDENYFSAWGYNYGNPETVTEETTLLDPYMDGAKFQGWYDNAEFTGTPVTTINASTTGTLYAKWDIVSYVTYELNGGVWNPYLWASKEDMLATFLTDGGATEKKTIEDCKSLVTTTAGEDGLHSPGLCTDKTLSASTLKAAFADEDKWGWLKTYVNSIHTAQGFSDLGSDFSAAAWKYEVGAFFISGQSTSWPKGASFAEAGKDENYFSAWGYSFGNPQSPINGFAPYKPFKWDNIFNGWYDNAEFSGDPVTSIPLGFNGTLYASWTRLSDVESPVVEQETLVNIYNISGACVLQGVDPAEVNNLAPGFYIVGNKKVLVK